MQFLFPGNAVASLLIYKLELLKLNLVSLPWKKATEQLMKGLLKQIIKNLIESWILVLKFTSQETIVCISISFPVIKKFSLQFKLAEPDHTFSEKAHNQTHIFIRGISNIQKSG